MTERREVEAWLILLSYGFRALVNTQATCTSRDGDGDRKKLAVTDSSVVSLYRSVARRLP